MYGEYLSINPKLRHGVHNAQESRDSLRFLSNFGLVSLLFAVDISYIQFGDSQD